MKMKLFNILIIFFLLTSTLLAKEFHYIIRSPYALLRGDAFTAEANDEYTLFYNPAGLGAHRGLTLSFINPDFALTNPIASEDQERFKDFPKKASDIADRVLGFPVHLKAGVTPTIKMQSFGLSLFANWQSNFILRNAIHPTIDIDYFYDRGFVAGYAFNFGNGGKLDRKGNVKAGTRTSVGFGVKHFNRDALNESFSLFGTRILTILNDDDNSDYSKIRNALGYSRGEAWGFDLGTQFAIVGQKQDVLLGLSIMDFGGTNFKRKSGIKRIDKQEMSINFGSTFRQRFGIFDYSVSFDLHPLNYPMDFGRKVHFGFDIGVLGIRALAGWNAGYLSYGASFDFWVFKMTMGFYTSEIGVKYKDQSGKRVVIFLSLLDFTFEP